MLSLSKHRVGVFNRLSAVQPVSRLLLPFAGSGFFEHQVQVAFRFRHISSQQGASETAPPRSA